MHLNSIYSSPSLSGAQPSTSEKTCWQTNPSTNPQRTAYNFINSYNCQVLLTSRNERERNKFKPHGIYCSMPSKGISKRSPIYFLYDNALISNARAIKATKPSSPWKGLCRMLLTRVQVIADYHVKFKSSRGTTNAGSHSVLDFWKS